MLQATTVANFKDKSELRAAAAGRVIWCDEASLLDNADMTWLLNFARDNASRLVVSGDPRQHGAVQRGQRASHRTQGVDPILSATGDSINVRWQIFSQIVFQRDQRLACAVVHRNLQRLGQGPHWLNVPLDAQVAEDDGTRLDWQSFLAPSKGRRPRQSQLRKGRGC